MNAFPQLVRSFEAQYRGLSDGERERLEKTRCLRVDHVAQQEQEIWTIQYREREIRAISVKQDVLFR